jgi:outer membrane receptor protein involved in Fe transport
MLPNLMKSRSRLALTAAAGVFLLPLARSQEVPAPASTDKKEDAAEDVVVLSPFEVTDDKAQGYLATSSLAGTRLNTQLKDVASAISVITPQFFQDTGATKVSDLLVYTTNTEVAGVEGNYFGSVSGDAGYINNLLRAPHKATRVRGLNEADLTRDFFLTDIPLDSYNISQVDIQRGPNSILFGLGSPAGIINYTMKTPGMQKDRYAAELRYGSYGRHRQSVDIDKTVIPGVLGVRVMAVNDEQQFEQDFKFDHSKRATVAGRWTPNLGDGVKTIIGVNYETGETSANRPRVTPPDDMLTTWFRYMNKWTKADVAGNGGPANLGPFITGSPANNWWDSLGVIYGDPNSNKTGGTGIPDAIRQRGGNPWGGWVGVANPNWNIWGVHPLANKATFANNPVVLAAINEYEKKTGKAFTGFGGWKDQVITDRSIFDYRTQTIEGPNSSQFNDFDAFNASIAQTYLNNRLGFEVSYNKQEYTDGYTNLMDYANRITVDINQFLRNGQPNPNLGRPMVVDATDGNIADRVRENFRATAFYKLDFEDLLDRKNLLTDIIGSHVLTGIYSSQKASQASRSFNLYGYDDSYTQLDNDDRVFGVHYLGSSLLNASSASGAHIQGIGVVRTPPTKLSAMVQGKSALNVKDWDVVQVGTFLDPTKMYKSATASFDEANNKSFVWQSRFLKDTVVGLFGYREDTYAKWDKPAVPKDAKGKATPFDPKWNFDKVTPLRAAASTRSYGVMVHSPEFIKKRLPFGSEISVGYNKSSNFRPSEVGTDIYGTQYDAPKGESEDYTVLVSALDERVSFRVTKYETTQMNTTWRGTGPGAWDIKGRLARAMNGLMTETWIDGRIIEGPNGPTGRQNTTPEFIVNKWMFGDTYDKTVAGQPLPAGWTVQNHPELLTQPLRIRASAASTPEGTLDAAGQPLSQPPISVAEADYRAAWFNARTDAQWSRPFGQALFSGLEFRRDPTRKWGFWTEDTPPNLKQISDIVSEGYEYELTVNPTKNWRIMVNAVDQKASAANIMAALGDFIVKNRAFWRDGFNSAEAGRPINYWKRDGFADIDFWGNMNSQSFAEWTTDMERKYLIGAASEGRSVNELRRWHFNVISSYDFTDGPLKGVGVGGAVRWQDKSKIGYAPKYLSDIDVWIDDLEKPYYAPSETNYDLWISYKRKLTKKIDMSVQLNLRNLFASDELIATAANPDGSLAQFRIPGETTWDLSTRFEF